MSVIITITGGSGDIIINAGIEGKQGATGPVGAGAEWGGIAGNLEDQIDLKNQQDAQDTAIALNTDKYTQAQVDTLLDGKATSAQGALADSALQNGDDVSELNNDAGYITAAALPSDTDDLSEGSVNLYYPQVDKDKLAGIEALAEVNQTNTEIKAQYEANANTNEYSDAEKNKLAGLDSSKFLGEYVSLVALETAHPSPTVGSYGNVDQGIGLDVVRYLWDSDDSIYVEQLGSSNILTDAQIKIQYENNANTNAYTDTEKTVANNQSGVNTGDQDLSGLALKSNVLELDNTDAFTPDADYEPATKKYVDDNTGGVTFSFYNDTGVTIPKGSVINAFGVDVASSTIKGILALASSPAFSSAVIGLAAADVLDEEVGSVVRMGTLEGFNTNSLAVGGPVYLATGGGLTNTRPQYPDTILILGTAERVDASNGKVLIDMNRFTRANVSKSISFTSQGIGTGIYGKSGYYDWSATDANLDQGSTSVNYGVSGRTKAAHVGIVTNGSGIVDTGQVGIRVTGTLDSDVGVQTASQTQVINDDITTLVANEMEETLGKFSGQVTIELYVVSGSPVNYSLDLNYGFSKYEDFFDRSATIIGFQAQWQGNATDASMNVRLLHHKRTGWTYAASGFIAGNGALADRLIDQAIESGVASGADGSYKSKGINAFIDSGENEGVIIEITVNNNNTIQTMDIDIFAVSEELS